MDVNRQAWSGATAFMAHPASHYVGLRSDRWFVDPGQSFDVEAIVADIDGQLIEASEIEMTAERLHWVLRGGEYVEDSVPAGTCTVTSGPEPVTCEFSFEEGGTYRLTAIVVDPEGRMNQTQLTLWVSGGTRPPQQGLEQEQVQLVPDADTYQPAKGIAG